MKPTHFLGAISALVMTLCSAASAESISNPTPAQRVGALEMLNLRTSGTVVTQAASNLRVSQVTVASIAAPFFTGAPFDAIVPLDGEAVTLRLAPISITTPDFKVFEDHGGGKLVQVDAGPARTFRGTVLERPGSMVAASLLDDGLFARVILEDGTTYWVEPLAMRVQDANVDDHAVYRGSSVIPSGATCATDAWAGDMPELPVRPSTERGGPCGANLCIATIAIDVDRLYYQSQGSSTSQTTTRIQSIINAVNVVYERDVQIRHNITTIIIRADDSDIYSDPSPGAMLNALQAEWNANQSGVPRDVVHLFTGRDLSGSTIGIAQLGVICNPSNAYSLVQPTCCGSFACQTDLSAHELGHNWNAPHCTCTQYTMNPSLTCRNVFNAGSIATITSFRDTRGCLAPDVLPPPPGAFGITSPTNGAFVMSTSPLLDWEPAQDAVTYTVRWANNPAMTNAQQFNVSVSQLVTSNNTFQDGVTYYWSVTANGQFGGTTPSTPAVANFTVQLTPPPPCSGDTNGDNQINGADLSVLLSQFGQSVTPGSGADFNNDGVVNGSDLSVLLSRFGTSC